MKNNFLVIISDQLTWRALPVYGNEYVKTPNIDRLLKNSVVFDRCYTPCPICQPARASFWSGLYPHEVDVLSNGRNWPVSTVSEDAPGLGKSFSQAGFEAVHFGKQHDSGALQGFECNSPKNIIFPAEYEAFPLNYDTYIDRDTRECSVDYLKNRSKDKPFLMVADLNNPHNICEWVGANAYENKDIPLPEGFELPPLPENFVFDDIENRPIGVQYICCSHRRQAQATGWNEETYRKYLAAYYYYITLLDKDVGLILDALEESGEYENTTFVFFADHGDSMVARGRTTKQVDFYEEVSRIPLIISGKGITAQKEHIPCVVSTLDVFPTLCSLAGIKIPNEVRGTDLSEILRDGNLPNREFIASQWHTEWGYTVSPGRMICTEKFKYTYYIEDNSEELFDLVNDPYEKINVAKDLKYSEDLTKMKNYFNEYLNETNDPFLRMGWMADSMFRTHEIGYQNHVEPNAPDYFEKHKKV